MTKQSKSELAVDRRNLLTYMGAGDAAAVTVPLAAPPGAEPPVRLPEPAHRAPVRPGADARMAAPRFLNPDEFAFVEAAVDTLIPHDDIGPGALELGVATFIDRQMADGYGKGDRLYLKGPFADRIPRRGSQLRTTPSDLMQTGIADVNAYSEVTYGETFDLLPPSERAAVLAGLEDGTVGLFFVPSQTFFAMLLKLTIEGYFADPMYGGNRGKVAWKMIGFPGSEAIYMDMIEPFRARAYTAGAVSIADFGQ